MSIRIVAGDITTFKGDAIVNAANNAGLGGGGVDGAIHRAAGPRLLEHCKTLPVHPNMRGLGKGMTITHEVRIPTGAIVTTPGFDLPCQYILHTAGPLFPVGEPDTTTLHQLQACYRNGLLVARNRGLKRIAFPAISAGVYGCPMDLCARTALGLANAVPSLDVTFYIFPEVPSLAIWLAVAKELGIEVAPR